MAVNTIGQSYNINGEKVYPRVVIDSFCDTSYPDKSGSSVLTDFIKGAVGDMTYSTFSVDTILLKKGIYGIDPSRKIIEVDGSGNGIITAKTITTDSIKESSSDVKIGGTGLTVTKTSVSACDGYVSINKTDKKVSIIDNYFVADESNVNVSLMGDVVNVASDTVSVTKPLSVTDKLSVNGYTTLSGNMETPSAKITTVDASTAKVDKLTVTDVSIGTSDGVLLSYKTLPAAVESNSERFVHYIGPTHYDTDASYGVAEIVRGKIYRCSMDFTISEDPDTSSVLDASFPSIDMNDGSFEPKMTLDWVSDNVPSAVIDNGDGTNTVNFFVYADGGVYKVGVDDGEGGTVDVGGDIYTSTTNYEKYRYCPFLWNYPPTTQEGVRYWFPIIFSNNYSWKMV